MTDYATHLAALHRAVRQEGAPPAAIDAAVAGMLADPAPGLAANLLAALSDEAAYDEGMFTLIHAAETVDDAPYVSALLSVFPHLAASAPRWASIVLMRVLNSRTTQLELVRQLRAAPEPARAAVADMCARIDAVSPEFLEKTVAVSLAAGQA